MVVGSLPRGLLPIASAEPRSDGRCRSLIAPLPPKRRRRPPKISTLEKAAVRINRRHDAKALVFALQGFAQDSNCLGQLGLESLFDVIGNLRAPAGVARLALLKSAAMGPLGLCGPSRASGNIVPRLFLACKQNARAMPPCHSVPCRYPMKPGSPVYAVTDFR
jgi:hypothetical protein